ncbi:MAG: hypothetical protein V3V08_00805 [Nannocystaceae bacterium]
MTHEVTLWKWFARVWRVDPRRTVFHLRYLMWRGYLLTLPAYLALVFVCRVRGVPIVWTCHNVRSHVIPSPAYNAALRMLVGAAASTIFVLHRDIAAGLPRFREKVRVACFGEFRTHLAYASERDPEFLRAYRAWLGRRGLASPDLIFVGAYAPSKRLLALFEALREDSELTALIVCPGLPPRLGAPNAFVHRRGKVTYELDAILNHCDSVGYVAHDNLSLPTAVHLFASYSIPCVAYDVPPLRSIVGEYGIGELFGTTQELRRAIRQVQGDYQRYRDAACMFLRKHSWEASQRVHFAAINRVVSDMSHPGQAPSRRGFQLLARRRVSPHQDASP